MKDGGEELFAPARADRAEVAGIDFPVAPIEPRVLIVDDSELIRRVLGEYLDERGLAFEMAGSEGALWKILDPDRYDVLILDSRVVEESSFALLDRRPTLADEAVVMLLSWDGNAEKLLEALRWRADDFLTKPFSIELFEERFDAAIYRWRSRLLARHYRNQLEALVDVMSEKLLRDDRVIEGAYNETVRALGAALHLKDSETEEHCRRVALNAVRLARHVGYAPSRLRQLQWGAYLHDIGKIGLAESILANTGALSRRERELMRLHPILGFRMISNIAFLKGSTDVVLYHHERYDGMGYPHGLQGKQIPLSARIFSVVDTMDAMLYDRPYREACSYEELREELLSESGKQFDPDIVSAFLAIPEGAWDEEAGR